MAFLRHLLQSLYAIVTSLLGVLLYFVILTLNATISHCILLSGRLIKFIIKSGKSYCQIEDSGMSFLK